MRRLSRRQFAGSVGAGLLLAPFINMVTRRRVQRPPVNRSDFAVLHDGDVPADVDADRDLRRKHHHLERDDPAAVGGEGQHRARRGDAQRQPEQRPWRVRQPDRPGLRLLRAGRHQDLRRPVHRQEAGGRGDQPADLVGAARGEHQRQRRHSQFYGGATGGNLPTIGSPLSAYNTVFGGALPAGTSASALLARRKSILDPSKPRRPRSRRRWEQREGEARRAPRFDPPAREQADRTGPPATPARSRPRPAPTARCSSWARLDGLRRTSFTRTSSPPPSPATSPASACLEYGNDQTFMVNVPGLPSTISTAASSTAARRRNFANLVKFEAYLATQFVNIINRLKGFRIRKTRRRRCSTRPCWCGRATWATPMCTTRSRCVSS